VNERSCAISFQAVTFLLLLFTIQKGAQDLLSYTTRRVATIVAPKEELAAETDRP
jgi:hypothetical protein